MDRRRHRVIHERFEPVDAKILVVIRPRRALSNRAFHRAGGLYSRKSCWSLQNRKTKKPVRLPRRIRGDRGRWTMQLKLEPGTYVLTTGVGRDRIRQLVVVPPREP